MKYGSFKNKNIYIFGGSSGIGLSTAKRFVVMGSRIFISARDETRLQNAAKKIGEQCHVKIGSIFRQSVDITDPDLVDSVIRETVEKHGAPDILINCAGRATPDYFEYITHDQFRETMTINLFGTRNTIFSALPYMKEKGGAIVNTSSVEDFLGVFGYTDYAASKFAVIGFSDSLRSELRKYRINVSVLCPPDTRV